MASKTQKRGAGAKSAKRGVAAKRSVKKSAKRTAAATKKPPVKSPPGNKPAKRKEPSKPPAKKLSIVEKIAKIQEVLESVRPMLQRDHGDVELADVQGKKIYVHLKGACSGCMMEAATLGGIQQKMIESLGELVQVLPASHMPVEA